MTTVLLFLLVLGVLVIIHELGHFTVAKLAGVKVHEFGVGYPPRIFGIRRGETDYTLNLLPLGGFVRMEGEDGPGAGTDSFGAKSARARLAILAAGPVMNALLPILLLTVVLMIPQQVSVADVTVVEVAPGSPAEAAGVLAGDVIRSVDGRTVENTAALSGALQLRLNADTGWVIERRGEPLDVRISEVRAAPPAGEGATGVRVTNALATVDSLPSGSPLAAAGLLRGDAPVLAGERQVLTADGLAEAGAAWAAERPGEPLPLKVMRAGRLLTLSIPAEALASLEAVPLTMRPAERRAEGLWPAIPLALRQMGDVLVVFRNEISRWISGASQVQISGPVGIAQATGEVARAGLSPLIAWAALLSINLAIINILPLPALDGGRITLVLVELARRGKRLAPEKERLVHLTGFALLMAGIMYVSVQDIARLLRGGSVLGGG
jgi:regulator of sigma E protease